MSDIATLTFFSTETQKARRLLEKTSGTEKQEATVGKCLSNIVLTRCVSCVLHHCLKDAASGVAHAVNHFRVAQPLDSGV